MNCKDVANLLDNRPKSELSPVEEERLAGHMLVCADCASAWRASALLRSVAEGATAGPRKELFQETMSLVREQTHRPRHASSSFWLGGVLGAAMAASIAIAVVFGVYSPSAPDDSDLPPAITIALNETRKVTFAIDSVESLADAEIHVTLTGGIELEGRPGQRDVRWTTDINAGVNRLMLPVIAVGNENAELLVEVGHDGRFRRFLVPIEVIQTASVSQATFG